MANGEIKRGDLVMVVAPTSCCGQCDCYGYTFTVQWLGMADGDCQFCGADGAALCADDSASGDDAFPVSVLRRIDPPATGEYDGVPVRRKLPTKEPA